MSTIAKLFGKSPFSPLITHMDKVAACVNDLPPLLEAIEKDDKEGVEKLVKLISKLEHEADLTKNDIRNHLPKNLFLPIDRSSLLEILSLQDSLADQAEDITVVATLHSLKDFGKFKEDFATFFHENIASVNMVHNIIKEIDELIETSFGGIEAQKVKEMVDEISLKEHEIDKLQYAFLKKIYSFGSTLDHVSFFHWISLIKEIGQLSNISEKLANRIRMVLDIK